MPSQKRVGIVAPAFLLLWSYILLSSGSWLRWRQIRYLFSEQSSLASLSPSEKPADEENPQSALPDYLPQLKAEAERSEDWRDKYAYLAVSEPQGEQKSLAKLLELANRYPQEPALIANWLRLACLKYLPVRARGMKIDGKPEEPPPADSPATLTEFVARAADAERRFPDNAYFRIMRISGLTAQKRDAEAERLLLDPSNALYPRYDDYAIEEGDAMERLKAEALGRRETLFAIFDYSRVLYPHYAGIREMAREALVSARRFETQGQHVKALRMRGSILSFGSLMFHQSQSLIGSLVGIAVFAIGAAPEESKKAEWRNEKERKRHVKAMQDKFRAYLIQRGERSLSEWVDEEFRQMTLLKDEALKSLEKSPMGMPALMKSNLGFAYDLFLVCNMARLVILALLLIAFRRVQEEYAKLCVAGVYLMLTLFVLWNPVGATVSDWQASAMIHILGAALPLCIVMGAIGISRRKREAFLPMLATSGVRAMTGVLLVLSLLYALSPSPRNESQWSREFHKMTRNEAAYYMEIAGKPLKPYQPIPPLNSSR